jgi:tRNA U34 5-carboxymethylaminomethyl modifying GTPase MnmE/TrmE
VTLVPGTTRSDHRGRDVHGAAVTLVDTAGVRESLDLIEAEGCGVREQRSRSAWSPSSDGSECLYRGR